MKRVAVFAAVLCSLAFAASAQVQTNAPLVNQATWTIITQPHVYVMYVAANGGATPVAPGVRSALPPLLSASVAGSAYDWLKVDYVQVFDGTTYYPVNGWVAGTVDTSVPGSSATDADIQQRITNAMGAGQLGPHSGNMSTDRQVIVAVVIPASLSLSSLPSNATALAVPYHAFAGTPYVPYVVFRDDAGWAKAASGLVISAQMNPLGYYTAQAWSTGWNSSPFREVGCLWNSGVTPVYTTAGVQSASLQWSQTLGACAGPPLQVVDNAGTPISPTQTQVLGQGVTTASFSFWVANRTNTAVQSFTVGSGCTPAFNVVPANSITWVSCTFSSASALSGVTLQLSGTLSGSGGTRAYSTTTTLRATCDTGLEGSSGTCQPPPPFDCEACACGCNATQNACARPPLCGASCARAGGYCDPCLGCVTD